MTRKGGRGVASQAEARVTGKPANSSLALTKLGSQRI